jgi:hypothetical protein
MPSGHSKRREQDGACGLQRWKMPGVSSRAAVVVGAMVIRMDLYRACRLHRGKAHQDEQNQQGSHGLAKYTHT